MQRTTNSKDRGKKEILELQNSLFEIQNLIDHFNDSRVSELNDRSKENYQSESWKKKG